MNAPAAGREANALGRASAAALIEARELRMVYRGREGEVEALRRLDFDIGVGEFVAVVGPSGCG